MQHLLIKCVEGKMYDAPKRIVSITDIRALVEQDPDLGWEREQAAIPVRNSDRSRSMLPVQEGFFVRSVAGDAFVLCYDCYQGIALHVPDNERIVRKCEQVAENLDAKLFRV